jgi:hypothetical protein
MKRAFLFGLGSFLVLGVIAGIAEAFKGASVDFVTGALMIAICAPLSVIVVRRANAAPRNKSRWHAIGGWLLGFLVVDGVMLGVIGLIALDNFAADVIVGALALFAVWFAARKHREAKDLDERRRDTAREANKILKDLNRSLGFPEGTGPTGIMVDGEYRIVNVGHTERMKNDPAYALGNEIAAITMEMTDLESALKEAVAQSDNALASKIRNELASLGRKANTLMDEYEREHKSKPASHHE